jgi:glutamate formiminotransferase
LTIRDPLVAFNVNVVGAVESARRVCASLRDLRGVRALAFVLASRDLVQISMNLTALDDTGPGKAFARTVELARAEQLEVVEAEVVGLVPESVASQLDSVPLIRPVRSIEQALAG